MSALSTSKKSILLLVTICMLLLGCNQQQSKTAQPENENSKAEATISILPIDELNQLALVAFREDRLYSPAGNNALEYYLAIRNRMAAPDSKTENALSDIAPYTVIATEQAIARSDFNEAIRLRDLIASIDAAAPALPRISQKITAGLERSEARVAAEIKQQQDALMVGQEPVETKVIAPPIERIRKPDPGKALSPESISTAEVPLQILPPSPTASSMPAAISNSVVSTPAMMNAKELMAIRTPDPSFPADAYNRGVSGSVEVEFIVQLNGHVSEVRVLNSSQRAFDRSVVSTVKRWKFGPLDKPMTVRRSFNFNNPS
jgi:periplasmic protein TonB